MIIAICDDEPRFLHQLKRTLTTSQVRQDTIFPFDTGQALLDHLNQHPNFDLIFLDVEMPGLNGLEIALEIKALVPHALIVILTAYPGYALESFKVRPFDYLVKPVKAKILNKVIEDARMLVEAADTFTFSFGYKQVTLPLRTIRYIQSHKWMMALHYGESVYHINARMKILTEQLAPRGFIRVHNSFLVNAAHIMAVDRQERTVTLASGEVIPVSSANMPDVLAAFLPKGGTGL